MSVRVVIPVRCADQPLRRRNLECCLRQLSLNAWDGQPPDFSVWVVEHDREPSLHVWVRNQGWQYIHVYGDGPFCKGLALNHGAAFAEEDLLLLLDADVWVAPDWIPSCLEQIDKLRDTTLSPFAMLPYDRFCFLAPEPSAKVAAGAYPTTRMEHESNPSVGGAIWIERLLWERIHGADEGYLGWGAEDRDLAMRLEHAMAEPIPRLKGPLWHLHHEEADRRFHAPNWDRFEAARRRLGCA